MKLPTKMMLNRVKIIVKIVNWNSKIVNNFFYVILLQQISFGNQEKMKHYRGRQQVRRTSSLNILVAIE